MTTLLLAAVVILAGALVGALFVLMSGHNGADTNDAFA